MKQRIKMIDIARAANVSQTTVSLILNQIPGVRIADETRSRVIAVAHELGYAPRPALHALKDGQRRLVGVLIDEISATYPVDLIEGLQVIAEARAAQLVVQVTRGAADQEIVALESLRQWGVGRVVYASTFTARVAPPPLLATFDPIYLNCQPQKEAGLAIVPGERGGGAAAAEHLIAAGRSRLAVITGDPWQVAAKERLAGFRGAMRRNGLALPDAAIATGDWSHRSGYAAMQALLGRREGVDGVFCQNDLMARGAMAAIADVGLSVPKDVAVVGYDDREFAKDLRPSLTTLALPHMEMAERAMTLVLEDAPSRPRRPIAVPCPLVIRASTTG